MITLPIKYSKDEFINHMNSLLINSKLIEKFQSIPLNIDESKLNIVVTEILDDVTRYNYSLNYFDEKTYKYLFKYKIDDDIDTALGRFFINLTKLK